MEELSPERRKMEEASSSSNIECSNLASELRSLSSSPFVCGNANHTPTVYGSPAVKKTSVGDGRSKEGLPQELVSLVISKLAIKNIFKNKCLSKHWKKHIESPHLDFHPTSFLVFHRYNKTQQPEVTFFKLIKSAGGLFLLNDLKLDEDSKQNQFYLWNPLERKYLDICPPSYDHEASISYGCGWNLNDGCKIIRMRQHFREDCIRWDVFWGSTRSWYEGQPFNVDVPVRFDGSEGLQELVSLVISKLAIKNIFKNKCLSKHWKKHIESPHFDFHPTSSLVFHRYNKTQQPEVTFFKLIKSAGGLFLLNDLKLDEDSKQNQFYLWNPLERKYLDICPPSYDHEASISYGCGWNLNDGCKIIRMRQHFREDCIRWDVFWGSTRSWYEGQPFNVDVPVRFDGSEGLQELVSLVISKLAIKNIFKNKCLSKHWKKHIESPHFDFHPTSSLVFHRYNKTQQPEVTFFKLIKSAGGLFLLNDLKLDEDSKQNQFYLWNPLERKYLDICPPSYDHEASISYGCGWNLNDGCKIIRMRQHFREDCIRWDVFWGSTRSWYEGQPFNVDVPVRFDGSEGLQELVSLVISKLAIKNIFKNKCLSKHWKKHIESPHFDFHPTSSLVFHRYNKTQQPEVTFFKLIKSAGGLFLLNDLKLDEDSKQNQFYLWNPLERKYLDICPPSYDHEASISYGCGWNLNDGCKIIRMRQHFREDCIRWDVFLGSTRSWYEGQPFNVDVPVRFDGSEFFNGKLYWIIALIKPQLPGQSSSRYILCCELFSLTFTQLSCPTLGNIREFSIKDGRLCISSTYGITEFSIWMMDDDYNWVEKYNIEEATHIMLDGEMRGDFISVVVGLIPW
ncbi:hypothetical protein OROMI_018477 [Orobanche minor]